MKVKQFRLSYIYVLIVIGFATACNNDEELPRGEFAKGVIIINEGNFRDSDGTIGFYDPSDKMATQNIYEKSNSQSISGLFQSIYTHDNKTYIIDQGGNKIVVVEAETFKYIATINQGLVLPRYMTIANGKGYVSNWGPYDAKYQTPNSFIAIIDLTNFNVSNTINTNNGVEGMITINDKVYAAASGANMVHVIDAEKDEIMGGFEVASGPRLFVEDANAKLWVICNNHIISSLVKIDISNSRVITTFEIANGAKSISSNKNGDKIYYLSTSLGMPAEIYRIDISATSAPQDALIRGDSFYGLGIDPSDETIYVGISNPTANGTIVQYNSEGVEISNFPSGRFPNGFEFRR